MSALKPIFVTLVVAGLVGLVGLGGPAVLDDPQQAVAAIDLTGSTSLPQPEGAGGDPLADDSGTSTQPSPEAEPPATQPRTAPPDEGTSQQIPALDELVGLVRDDGDDVGDLAIGGVELDFGPDAWVATAGALEDYDGDGTIEPFGEELSGLLGNEARLRVRFDHDGDDADVYVINGLSYREVSGPAPWLAADAVSEEEIRRLAAAAVGEGAQVVDLDPEAGATVAWDAEVLDSQGREYEVLLDAGGNVVDVQRD